MGVTAAPGWLAPDGGGPDRANRQVGGDGATAMRPRRNTQASAMACTLVSKPFQCGATDPDAFDCSGLKRQARA